MDTVVVYFHGFNSAPTLNAKTVQLQNLCTKHGYTFITPRINYEFGPHQVMDRIKEIHRAFPGCDVTWIGTSFGGLLARAAAEVYGDNCVMINPSMSPWISLRDVADKPLTNFVTNEQWVMPLDILEEYKVWTPNKTLDIPTLVLLDLGDERLDSSATAEFWKDRAEVKTFEGGSHRFDHIDQSLEDINRLINTVC